MPGIGALGLGEWRPNIRDSFSFLPFSAAFPACRLCLFDVCGSCVRPWATSKGASEKSGTLWIWEGPFVTQLGKNTGMGCHFLLQCMKVKSESEVAQSCPTLRDPMACSLPGSSVHGIFQARVLEWGAIAFSAYTHYCI